MNGKNMGGPVDLTEWHWGLDLDKIVGKAVSSAIKSEIKRAGVDVRVVWPADGGDKDLYIGAEMNFLDSRGAPPMFSAKLKDVIKDEVFWFERQPERIRWMRDQLQSITDNLTRELNKLA